MWGNKGRRIAELEREAAAMQELLEADAVKLNRIADQTAALRAKVVGQRRQLREVTAALRQDRERIEQAATAARLVIAGWADDSFPDTRRHDGNHPYGECAACDAFRALEPYAHKPWHHVIRGLGPRCAR